MEQWEYFVKDIYTEDKNVPSGQMEVLNFYGRQGWELVTVCDSLAYFKRRIKINNFRSTVNING